MTNVKLDQGKTSYDELEKHYHGFMAPSFKIVINNIDIVREEGMAVNAVTVETATSETSDMVTFSVTNAYDLIKRDFSWINKLLKLGNSVEVSFGYLDRLTPIFFGYISGVEFEFSADEAPIISITAMDISFYMMRGNKPDVWTKKKISDLAEEIGKKYGLTSFAITDTKNVIENIAKSTESDHKFLNGLAEDLNYQFFVVGKKMYFRENSVNETPVMELEWGKHLTRFKIEHELAEQVTKVVVKATLRNEKKTITVESSDVETIGTNTRTGANIMSVLADIEEVIQRTVEDEAEARKVAESRMQELSMELVTVEGSCIGLPELRAGKYIKVGGLGTGLNNTYYIESATHTIGDAGYVCNFTLKGNAV